MKFSLSCFCLLLLLTASGCASQKDPEVKSPCAGGEGSPCDRRSVNDWWLS